MSNKYIRPFLKWPGGKYRVLDKILPLLPDDKKTLVEPFVGAGSVFLNTNYDKYIVGDINADLINLYKTIKKEGLDFIDFCESFFTSKHNNKRIYYSIRKKFNSSTDKLEKSALFLYLNRHGYNGLCRYNKSRGEYNVPFGTYKKPYFPRKELIAFLDKAKKTKFYCASFTEVLSKVPKEAIVYADPPYVPISRTANFTQYHANNFNEESQEMLADIARSLSDSGTPVILSNHSTRYTKKIYSGSRIHEFFVPRFISCKSRGQVKELLAVYK